MLLVVVLATDVVRIVLLPQEGDSVLLVHANAVLTLSVSSQGLETVARHRRQIIRPLRAVEQR